MAGVAGSSDRLRRSTKPEQTGSESEGHDQPNRNQQRDTILGGLFMPWSRIATLIADFLILREDSVTRLAANHMSIKPNNRFSVYRPYVPFSPRAVVAVPVCGA